MSDSEVLFKSQESSSWQSTVCNTTLVTELCTSSSFFIITPTFWIKVAEDLISNFILN